VVVSGRHDEAAKRWRRSCAPSAQRPNSPCGRAPEDDAARLVDRTVARFGRLDAAVNSAGNEGRPGPVTQQTADSYAATFDTNVLGTLLSMKHELRVHAGSRQRQHRQHSSTYGHDGAPGASVYSASKHAVEGLHHQIRGARGRRLGRPCQRRRASADRARMLNRFTGNAEGKSQPRLERAAASE